MICQLCGRTSDTITCIHCQWLSSPQAQDLRNELAALVAVVGRPATAGWVWRLGRDMVELETTGATHFGAGDPRPDLIAHHLIRRVKADGWNHMRVTSYMAMLVDERTDRYRMPQ